MPMNPNLIHIGGLHVTGADYKTLSEEVNAAIEKGPKGFIMMATGHLADLKHAKPEVLKAFINAFNRVAAQGYAVLWQQANAVEGLADGVTTMKWLPQRELLGKPMCLCNGQLRSGSFSRLK